MFLPYHPYHPHLVSHTSHTNRSVSGASVHASAQSNAHADYIDAIPVGRGDYEAAKVET